MPTAAKAGMFPAYSDPCMFIPLATAMGVRKKSRPGFERKNAHQDSVWSNSWNALGLEAVAWEDYTASYYRARYYDPAASRFLSDDPIGFRAGINFYRYVRNSASNWSDPSGMYTLKNFTPEHAAQITMAIGKLVAKLNNSCCIDPDVRRRILNHLQPFSYGSGATFTYAQNLIVNGKTAVGSAGPFPFERMTISESAMNGSDTCPLEGIILHELVHLTWHNVGLGIKDRGLAETDAYAKSAACYGSGCQKPPEP